MKSLLSLNKIFVYLSVHNIRRPTSAIIKRFLRKYTNDNGYNYSGSACINIFIASYNLSDLTYY
jgi:hypothetical protein